MDFLRQLLVFSSINIGITILFLIATTLTYRKKLNTKKLSKVKVNANHEHQSGNLEKIVPKRLSFKSSTVQEKATCTLILMLCVFLITYLPTIVTVYYVNIYTECSCVVVHVIRDVSFLLILSSSVFRPLNFILTLRHLRTSVIRMFKAEDPVNTTVIHKSKTSNSKKESTFTDLFV